MSTTTRPEPWTSADVARLREELRARRPDWADLSQALGRSEKACRNKAARLGLLAQGDGHYPQVELARLLGVSATSVAYWREQRMLVGTAAGRAGYRYSRRAVRAFVRAHPDLLGERVDRRWLVELLAGGGGKAA